MSTTRSARAQVVGFHAASWAGSSLVVVVIAQTFRLHLTAEQTALLGACVNGALSFLAPYITLPGLNDTPEGGNDPPALLVKSPAVVPVIQPKPLPTGPAPVAPGGDA